MPIAIVTGASSGIGEAICRKLLQSTTEKWNVVMIARTKFKMKAIAKACKAVIGNNVLILSCDVTIPEKLVKTCIAPIKRWLKTKNMEYIDVLINNAGGFAEANGWSLDTCNLEDWTKMMHLNVTSMFLFTKHLLPLMDASPNMKYKSIINIGSISGERASSEFLTYHVGKAAVHQFTKCAALHCAEKYKNIRVNCLAMSYTVTGLQQKSFGKTVGDESAQQYAKRTPMGRIGTTDDIVNAIEFFMDAQKSGWVTGDIMIMDGGLILSQWQTIDSKL